MVKMKNKIGCFRSSDGAKDFLTLKSFTSTTAKAGQPFLLYLIYFRAISLVEPNSCIYLLI